jgi:N-acetylmuramoyl-L-alanine amidase
MIAALLLALQLAAAAPPSVLTARAGGSETVAPLARAGGTAAVRLDLIAPVIPVTMEQTTPGRWNLSLAGIGFSVAVGERVVRLASGEVLQLATAPFEEDGHLFLPLQLLAEQLPRVAPDRLRYNPIRGELRLLDAPGRGADAGSSRAIAGAFGAAPEAAQTPASARKPAAPAARSDRLTHRRRVVVDAGHGGPDNGMSGPIGGSFRVYEKNITLAVAKRLAEVLRARGVDVVMTRTTDTLIALSDRGRIANARQGDVFVSIHVNAANTRWERPAAARGFETYFLSEAKTEDEQRVERMENEAVRFETSVTARKNDPLSFIINDMAQNEHLRESNDLASEIQGRLAGVHPGPNRGVKQANFAVLRTSFMPAVLVEIGFGTNAEEARYLTTAARQQEVAEAVADATVRYLARYERKVGVSER